MIQIKLNDHATISSICYTKLIQQALNTNEGGYIWHTTGSGKTLTSFKCGQLLAKQPSIKKVLFVVDRSDLDRQTTQEFNKFELTP